MRILYDVSTLGLGHLYVQSRGGSYRADRHLTEGLVASGECELLFCANHSSVAYQGCQAYLRANPQVGDVRLVGPGGDLTQSGMRRGIRRGVAAAHRWTRVMVGSNVLPGWLRQGGAFVDRRVHPAVRDASPPVDVFHSPAAPLPPRPRVGRSPKRFLTIYDLSYIRFPDIYGPAYSRRTLAALDSVQDEDWLMTTSESTRAELCERGVAAPNRVFVLPLAADRQIFYPCADLGAVEAVRDKYGIPAGPYLLSVNAPDPRKNMPHAVRSFARVVEQEGVRDLTFVLVGHPGSDPRQLEDAVELVRGLRNRIIVTGYVADDDLAPLYSGATAFVYPSLYEGFGLPPLEALQCGTPVITSNTSSLPEVVGGAAMMVDPGDNDALCSAMLEVYRSGSLRAAMREKSLVQAARFSWERSTKQILAAYRTALSA